MEYIIYAVLMAIPVAVVLAFRSSVVVRILCSISLLAWIVAKHAALPGAIAREVTKERGDTWNQDFGAGVTTMRDAIRENHLEVTIPIVALAAIEDRRDRTGRAVLAMHSVQPRHIHLFPRRGRTADLLTPLQSHWPAPVAPGLRRAALR